LGASKPTKIATNEGYPEVIRKEAPVAQVQTRWPRFRLAETDASDLVSAACYRLSKNVGVVPTIVAKLELGDVQRKICFADLVISADNPALDQRPEAFNGLSVHRADNVFASGMINRLVRIFLAEMLVTDPLIAAQQANLVGNGFTDEALQGRGLNVFNDPGDNIALATDCTSNDGLATAASSATTITAFVFVPVLGEAANESFVNLDNANEFFEFLVRQCCANAMAHVPSRFVGTEAHVAMDLPCADALLAGQHKVDDAKPLSQVYIRVLENRSGNVREPIAARAAIRAFPFEFHGSERIDPRTAAAGTVDAIGPTMGHEIGVAGVLVREGRFPLGNGHLVDLAGLLGAGHDGSLSTRGSKACLDQSVKYGITAQICSIPHFADFLRPDFPIHSAVSRSGLPTTFKI
jgi:hypothetical protein